MDKNLLLSRTKIHRWSLIHLVLCIFQELDVLEDLDVLKELEGLEELIPPLDILFDN